VTTLGWSDERRDDPELPWQEGDSPAGCLLTLAIVMIVAAAIVTAAGA